MAAHGLQAALVEQRAEGGGAEVVGAGELDLLDAEFLHAIKRPRHAAQGELAAQAVKLQTGRIRCALRLNGSGGQNEGEKKARDFHENEHAGYDVTRCGVNDWVRR